VASESRPAAAGTSDLRILAVQTRFAIIGGMRSSNALIFGIVFPIFLLVLFNEVFVRGGGSHTTKVGGVKIELTAYYTAGLIAYSVMLQTFSSLAIVVTTQRETGQLKRLRGTPMPAWTFIAAYVLRAVTYVAAMVTVLLLIGLIAFNVKVHASGIVGLIVYVAVGTAALASLGMAVTIICKTAESASTVGPFSSVILSFISGVFIPVTALPGWLQTIGNIFPLAHLASGIQRGLVIGSTGSGITAKDLGILAAWAVFGLFVAARWFRWEPQAAAG
jgi:ABC-2 type transport system permease protein